MGTQLEAADFENPCTVSVLLQLCTYNLHLQVIQSVQKMIDVGEPVHPSRGTGYSFYRQDTSQDLGSAMQKPTSTWQKSAESDARTNVAWTRNLHETRDPINNTRPRVW